MGFTGKISSKSLFGAVALFIVAGSLVCTGASRAATVRGGSTIVYKAARGEQNKLAIYLNDGKYQFHEQLGVPMTTRSSCAPGRQWGQPVIECPAANVRRIVIKLDSGDDQVIPTAPAPERGFRIDGGRGNDVIFGSAPPATDPGERVMPTYYGDTLIGGFGNDTLVGLAGYDKYSGGSGDDKIWSAGDGYPDRVTCSSGADQATGDIASSPGMPKDMLLQCEQPLGAMPTL